MSPARTTVLLIAIAEVCVAGCAGPKIPPGLGSEWADVEQVLDIYAQLTGKTVEFADETGDEHTVIRIKQTESLTRAQARRFLERVLDKQAGIVILSRHHKRVIFGKRMVGVPATVQLSSIEKQLAHSTEEPVEHLVTLLSVPGAMTNQESLHFIPAIFSPPTTVSPDEVLGAAFEDNALLSLRRVKTWGVVREQRVHAPDAPKRIMALVRTNVGTYVVVLDNFGGWAWQATFYRCN